MQARSQQTLAIEAMLRNGKTNVSAIAREMGLSRHRVRQIRNRLFADYESVTKPANESGEQVSDSHMKSLTINLTPAVYDALVEACGVANRKTPEDSITITEYVEECIISRLVELGLLRRNKRK